MGISPLLWYTFDTIYIQQQWNLMAGTLHKQVAVSVNEIDFLKHFFNSS